jgi:CBS domain containing-hemolysin-like protein
MLSNQMHDLTLLQFVAVAMLILANAFFVAAEFALVSIRETRIEQLEASDAPGARAVRRLQRGLDDLLPAVQLGVTLCSLALGWLGEPLAASVLLGPLSALPHAQVYAHVAAVTLGFALITYFHVVAGELVPKALALRRAEALALAVAPPMLIFMAMARPLVRILKGSAAVVLRAFDVPFSERSQVHSAEELKLLATSARRMGLLPEFEELLVHRALELDEVPVREIMTPRQKIFSLPSSLSVEEAGTKLMANHHSRIPIYDEKRGPEYIVGVVYARDLVRLLFYRAAPGAAVAPFASLRLGQVMRDVLIVPETKPVLDLLREFQLRRRQMAIAVDEYGSTAGLVTAEDAIEQLIGELEDEFDSPAAPALNLPGGALLMDGGTNLRDLEMQMQWDLPRAGGVETLAGFLLVQFGHIPHAGESVVYDHRRLTVDSMEGRRIARVRVEPELEIAAPTEDDAQK